jgi:hypothetical protein
MKPDDEWQERATAAAIAAARNAISEKATVLVGRLSDREWGWIVAAAIFAWIKTRAEQATAEGLDTESALRVTGQAPEPWDAGAIVSILPELADAPNVDWSLPLAEWSQKTMVGFLATALALMRKAMAARDRGGAITQKTTIKFRSETNA